MTADCPSSSVSADATVHSTALVEDGATVGSQTAIWHHSHVRASASVGTGCTLGKNVYVDAGVTIGDRCKIQNNVSVYQGVTIGNDVFVGPSATFTNDKVPRAFNTEWKIVQTNVEDGASIGANATIVCGVTVGRYAMVAAGATVTKDVAGHQLVAGNPAHHLGWVCRCGHLVTRDTEAPASMTCPSCAGADQ